MEEKELWHVRKVTAEEYESLVPNKGAFFNEPRFTELNKNKADEVYYLILMRAESARFVQRQDALFLLHIHIL